ncbi:MAG: diaminopimelate decarboxylase, partial [Gaiellales bacterium]
MRTGLTDVLPATAVVQDGELTMGGVRTSALAEEFGTPLVVYCEQTMLDQARAYRQAAPDARVLYSVKAFQSVALLRLFAGEGLGADVSTFGELSFALRAGVPADLIVVHGNNKSDEELRAAAD